MIDRDELLKLLTELLDAYTRESAALNDPREPERYREDAQKLVAKIQHALSL